MGLFSILGGDRLLPETKEALRDATRRDPRMREVAREARWSLFNGQEDHRADADRRDDGFWRW